MEIVINGSRNLLDIGLNHLTLARTRLYRALLSADPKSAVGNLPELCVAIFALKAGLITVVQASLIGSILGNSLLVLGLAFLVGCSRHRILNFDPNRPRMIAGAP